MLERRARGHFAEDAEALAILPNQYPVIAAERQRSRSRYARLYISTQHIDALNGAPWVSRSFAHRDFATYANEGIEGLCSTGTWMFAVAESALPTPHGTRKAAAFLFQMQDSSAQAIAARSDGLQTKSGSILLRRRVWLELSSDTGKYSAAECLLVDNTLVVLLAERHFGLSFLVSARVPVPSSSEPPRAVYPTVLTQRELDLFRLLPGQPNLEGIALLPKTGRLCLISDSAYGRNKGPTYLFCLPTSAIPSLRGVALST